MAKRIKNAWIVVYLIIGYIFLQSCSDCESKISRSIDNLEFNGVIEERYIDSSNHLYPSVTVKDNSGKEVFFIAYERFSGKDFFNYIEPGDSVRKEKFSRDFTVIRLDQVNVFTFKCK